MGYVVKVFVKVGIEFLVETRGKCMFVVMIKMFFVNMMYYKFVE